MKKVIRIVSLIGISAIALIGYYGSANAESVLSALQEDIDTNATDIGTNDTRITALEDAPRANIAATAPTVTDDINAGYSVGSVWVDITQNQAYILVDSAPGTAAWKQITNATNEIFVLAVSGSLVSLNGTYAPGCIGPTYGGGSYKEVWIFLGDTINTTTSEYPTDNCTENPDLGVTIVSTLEATFELAGEPITILRWVDDQGNPVSAPTAADDNGPLSDLESVSPLIATIIATTGPSPGPDAGLNVPLFFVVDDTGTNNILYGAYDDYNSGMLDKPEAKITHPLIKQ